MKICHLCKSLTRYGSHGHGVCSGNSARNLPRCKCGSLATMRDGNKPVCVSCAPEHNAALLIAGGAA